MSEPLLLIDRLLAKVRYLEKLGCREEAQRLLTRLANFRNLTRAVAVEVRTRLARLLLRQRRPGAARPHLTAALLRQPRHALSHYLLARATRARGQDDLERMANHLRQSVQLAPRRPRYLIAFGKVLLKLGKVEKGVTCLRWALTLAPENVRVLARVVRELLRAEQGPEARRIVQAALFQLPHCPMVMKLWRDVRFQEARELQTRRRQRRAERQAVNAGPVLLSFVQAQPMRGARKSFRLDGAASLPAPHFPRSLRTSDRERA